MRRWPGRRGGSAALIIALLAGGCVKRSTHEAALAALRDDADTEEARLQALLDESREREAQLEADLAAEQEARAEEEQSLRARIAALEAERSDLQSRLDVAADRFEEARSEVARLEFLLNETGQESRVLTQRLQSLAAVEREVRERNQIYEEVIGRFRSLIDGGQLSVSIERGRMVIHLPQDILFPSGSATLGAEGRQTIGAVAEVLADLDDRTFQVEGHTDNVPISTQQFPSNWELSSARALSVVRLLIDRGVQPENLSGAAYGEYQPVASNADRESRMRNRRIEIVMLPNLDVIAAAQVPGGS